MRRYETIVILDPDLSEDQRSAVVARTKEVIPQEGGFLAFIDEWGTRQLAYEIKKKERGYYVRFDFCGNGAVIDEIERFYRIDDRVLKYMTVLTDATPDLDGVKEEIAQAESEKAQAEAKAAEEAQAKAEAEAVDEKPAEDEAPVEADTPVEDEAAIEAEAPNTDEAPANAEQSDLPAESAPSETESVADEAVPTESEEEKK